MYRFFLVAAMCCAVVAITPAAEPDAIVAPSKPSLVLLQTSHGDITIELYEQDAPKTVANFLAYVRSGFYTDTIFHRVIPDFMIQGGGFTSDMSRQTTGEPIANEADNGLRNVRGSVAMARTQDPHSATAQFFINLKDNKFLDHTAKNTQGWGYTVFGRVTDGMATVDTIAEQSTTMVNGMQDVPREPIVILNASELTPPGSH